MTPEPRESPAEAFHHPGYEPVDAGDVARVRAAVDTTSVDGTDTEFAPGEGDTETH